MRRLAQQDEPSSSDPVDQGIEVSGSAKWRGFMADKVDKFSS